MQLNIPSGKKYLVGQKLRVVGERERGGEDIEIGWKRGGEDEGRGAYKFGSENGGSGEGGERGGEFEHRKLRGESLFAPLSLLLLLSSVVEGRGNMGKVGKEGGGGRGGGESKVADLGFRCMKQA